MDGEGPTKAEWRGFLAGKRGAPDSGNPYKNRRLHREWLRGWREGHEELLATPYLVGGDYPKWAKPEF